MSNQKKPACASKQELATLWYTYEELTKMLTREIENNLSAYIQIKSK